MCASVIFGAVKAVTVTLKYGLIQSLILTNIPRWYVVHAFYPVRGFSASDAPEITGMGYGGSFLGGVVSSDRADVLCLPVVAVVSCSGSKFCHKKDTLCSEPVVCGIPTQLGRRQTQNKKCLCVASLFT